MSYFLVAYPIVQVNEGGYVNDPDDLGGETYRGIARKIHATWEGWFYIDIWTASLHTTEGRTPRTGEFVNDSFTYADKIDELVESFYQSQWNASKAGQIGDQAVANMYFDMYILSSKAVLLLQQSVNKLGKKVVEDNRIGSQTLAAVNAVDPVKLRDTYTKLRIAWHKEQVALGRVNGKYLNGWIIRAMKFSPVVDGITTFLKGGAIVGTIVLAIYLSKTKRKKQ